jgi:3-deoxy-D-manno-oct-2-ulosonic acid (Kdo) hydroxylase
MNKIEIVDLSHEQASCPPELQTRATEALENGAVLFLPHFSFPVRDEERPLFTPTIVGKSKNVSYNPDTATIGGTSVEGPQAEVLRQMMARFATTSRSLVNLLFPDYTASLRQARASFRPVEIAGRASSWRKDDTRLHLDSFPSAPTQGSRILRVFINVNPQGKGRVWRIGESFENVATRFLPATKRPLPGSSALLKLLHVTKTPRSEYDHIMLQLHDLMKADMDYQQKVDQIEHEFPAGSAWIGYADQVSHAVMRGQYQLEQTFLIPIASLRAPQTSPLSVLERLTGRQLVSAELRA